MFLSSPISLESNSGKQVIILGSLLGGLILLIYGLKIRYYIKNRKKQTPKPVEKYLSD